MVAAKYLLSQIHSDSGSNLRAGLVDVPVVPSCPVFIVSFQLIQTEGVERLLECLWPTTGLLDPWVKM